MQSERDDGADVVELSDSSDDEAMTASSKADADDQDAQNGSVGDKNKYDRIQFFCARLKYVNAYSFLRAVSTTPLTATDEFTALLDCDWLKVVKLTVDWLRFSAAFITSAADVSFALVVRAHNFYSSRYSRNAILFGKR